MKLTTGSEEMAKTQQKVDRQLVTGGDPEELFPIPAEQVFTESRLEYLDAQDLSEIGEALIEHQGGFGYLKEMNLVYLWASHGGKSHGKAVLGRCRRPKGLLAKFCDADFIITVSADHCREFRMTRYQLEAIVFHELCHTDYDESKGKARLVAHDYEGFCREVEVYGAWKEDLACAAKAFEQLKLL
jgi:hypothetical protein